MNGARARTAAATLLLCAPALFATGALVRALSRRPAARIAVAPAAVPDPLDAGSRFAVALPAAEHRYRWLVLTPEVAGPPAPLEIRTCVADRCATTQATADTAVPLRVALPPVTVRGGTVELEVHPAGGGAVRVRRWGDARAIEAVQGFSWVLPVRKAGAVYRAMSSRDGLPVALAVYGALLAAALGFALREALRRPPARGEADAAAPDRAP